MVNKTAEKLRRKAVRSFMDILILAELNDSPMSGYDVIGHIHKRYGILVSSGTVYSLLYSMERNGLIRAVHNQRKRAYELTEKAERDMQVVTKANEEIKSFLRTMLLFKD